MEPTKLVHRIHRVQPFCLALLYQGRNLVHTLTSCSWLSPHSDLRRIAWIFCGGTQLRNCNTNIVYRSHVFKDNEVQVRILIASLYYVPTKNEIKKIVQMFMSQHTTRVIINFKKLCQLKQQPKRL